MYKTASVRPMHLLISWKDPIFSFYKEIHKLIKTSINVWFVPE